MLTSWQIGDRIQHRWEIHDIKRGGMGIVYIVYDHDWREPFAAKTFQDEVFVRHPAVAERFVQEALAWVNLDPHQNITEAVMVQQIESKPFLFLEYVSRGDLGGLIGNPRLTENLPEVLRLAIQFCDGMTHVFSKGIKVHRDIKPQNCLITSDFTLKVTDFGLAKVFEEPTEANAHEAPRGFRLGLGMSRTGLAVGTPTHMAPEQFDDSKNVDVRADIYSFGVMLFQMITGRLPFTGESWVELEQAHKTGSPPQLDTHPGLLNLVHTCLKKDPLERFGSFGAVRTAAAEIYKSLTGARAPDPAPEDQLTKVRLGNKGGSLAVLGRTQQAIECFDRVIEMDPRDEQAWYNKGVCLDELSHAAEAYECYEQATRINRRYGDAWYNMGFSLAESGRHEEAIECFDRAIEIQPRNTAAWTSKGNSLADAGRNEEAIECFDRAIELDPRRELPWLNKGLTLIHLGRREEAIVSLDAAIKINPRAENSWRAKAGCLIASERFVEAIECLSRAIEINPRNLDLWFYQAELLRRCGRLREAEQCLKKAYRHSDP
jgi:tetratricopeptide (TPR) repeat protein